MKSLMLSVFRDPRLQRLRRLQQFRSRRLGGLEGALPRTTCVDVGASYYPHTSWWLFLDSLNTRWVAVEPNEQNLSYVASWPWKARISTVTTGLSDDGGPKTLYVTNADSGSSLLRPVIPAAMDARAGEAMRKYFFPSREVQIDTTTLARVVTDHSENPDDPVMVKLDTQGSELSILRSVVGANLGRNVVGVEIECSLLATPYYEGSPRLWEVAAFMESNGFEALQIDVVPRVSSRQKISSAARQIANESDVIFAMRPDIASTKPIETRAALLGFYVTNCFYGEALILLSSDTDVSEYLQTRGCDVASLAEELTRRTR